MSCEKDDSNNNPKIPLEEQHDFIDACNYYFDEAQNDYINNKIDLFTYGIRRNNAQIKLIKFLKRKDLPNNVSELMSDYITKNKKLSKTKEWLVLGNEILIPLYRNICSEVSFLVNQLDRYSWDYKVYIRNQVIPSKMGNNLKIIQAIFTNKFVSQPSDIINLMPWERYKTRYNDLLTIKLALVNDLTLILNEYRVIEYRNNRGNNNGNNTHKRNKYGARKLTEVIKSDSWSNNQCADGVLNSLADKITLSATPGEVVKDSKFKQLFYFFDNSSKYQITFTIGNLSGGANGRTERTTSTDYLITIDDNYINNATLLSLGRTIIHEMIHVKLLYLTNERDTQTINELMKNYSEDINIPHHELMAKTVMEITTMLQEWDNNRLGFNYYSALAWGGLDRTSLFEKLKPISKSRINQIIYNEATNNNKARGATCPN
jgi:hypothetical protein